MAKWGEGDPRWIVEERPDATNVNNWHWTEKNASVWSKDKLTELLLNLKIDEPGLGIAEINEISSIEGEAIANNRKAKLIFFYEWNVKASWRGRLNGVSDSEVKGAIEIPNLSEENTPDEVDVNVTLKSGEGTVAGDALKEIMRNKGTQVIRERIGEYIKQLKEEYAKDLILPTKDLGKSITTDKSEPTAAKVNRMNGTMLEKTTSNDKLEMKSLKMSEEMKCRAEEVFRAFTDIDMVKYFSNGPAIVEPKPSGQFSLFDGNVTGIFIEVEPNKLIKQKWRFKTWPENHYSIVVIEFEEAADHTLVKVTQSAIPSNDYERTESGWKKFYFEAMKRCFGFGSMLY